ncbi:endospore germination permease [Clostridium sp. MB40-C1]|uniref:GerAB/ArcD/ProY family transporter n=1 Tax=Clostridium sp. MB40-C1 TaxID=3070996 RepID=UPI0027E105E2|nr:endospore germination permease [Clostridium sp. MB40-C1]WMJ80748.1 endospore germination permease [Clostridium sp. MB40-C1]
MNNKDKKYLTSSQLVGLLMGFAIGPGLLRSPNSLIKFAEQDAWISSIIGLIYPLYIIIVANFIIKKYPDDNILSLSRKCFGEILGNIFNFIYGLQWIIFVITISTDLIKISRIYFVAFLTPVKVVIILIAVSIYAAYRGLESLATLAQINSYLLVSIMLFSTAALKYGRLFNIQPIFGSGMTNIIHSSFLTFYYYLGFENLLLIHPFAKDTVNIKKSSFIALLISSLIWVWAVFITIYYLGIDIIPKSFWSFILVFESINLPIVNNFRYIFMFVWTFAVFIVLSGHSFTASLIMNNITNINRTFILIFLYFLCTLSSLWLISLDSYKNALDAISIFFTIYNVVFISIISIIIYIKNKTFSKRKVNIN